MEKDINKELPKITIKEFFEKCSVELKLSIIAGEKGLEKKEIASPKIQKLGLALADPVQFIHKERVQIIGESEISFLYNLSEEKRIQAIRNLDHNKICCLLITKNIEPPKDLLVFANENDLPVLRTSNASSETVNDLSKFLGTELAPHLTLHGVLLGMYGIGVLILGDSGIGKSECALDLISRGHRLIADDAVKIKKIREQITGESPEITYEHLEIRGLGIINIREIFGISAVGKKKRVELIIELKAWDELIDVERFGLELQNEKLIGVKVNKFVLPVSVGRNLATLMETAVRLYLLKTHGFNAAQRLFEKHSEVVKEVGKQ